MKNQEGQRLLNALKVIRVNDEEYWVENPEQRACSKVVITTEEESCSCADFMIQIQKDPEFKCRHILSVVNGNGNVKDAEFVEKRRPKLDERFIKNIQGRDFVVYSGVLDLAHQKGLKQVVVEVEQFPSEDNGNEAICKATVESENGDVFVEWGDANPKNVNPKVVRHILRLAATRAKARALRDFTNVGITCLEEIDDLDDETGGSNGKKYTPARAEQLENAPAKPAPDKKKTTGTTTQKKADQPKQEPAVKLSSAQLRAIESISKRRGITREGLDGMIEKSYGVTLETLGASEAASFIRTLQQSA